MKIIDQKETKDVEKAWFDLLYLSKYLSMLLLSNKNLFDIFSLAIFNHHFNLMFQFYTPWKRQGHKSETLG